ncbi:MAG: BamA/TamA family outer membrane protein [Paracoccaceae bacterium]
MKIPIKQDGDLARVKFSYGVTPDLPFGTTIRYLNTTITPDVGLPPLPPQFDIDTDLELINLGLVADWDIRDKNDYPTEGARLSFEVNHGQTISGFNRNYAKSYLLADKYVSFGNTSVLAGRAALCGASTDTPFFDLCSIGATDSFRGFSSTQFLDQRLLSFQLEWRQRLTDRWGVIGFGGIGWTGPDFDNLTEGGSHRAIGAGVRFRISKQFPVDFAVDVSHNNLDEQIVYVSVGQRF